MELGKLDLIFKEPKRGLMKYPQYKIQRKSTSNPIIQNSNWIHPLHFMGILDLISKVRAKQGDLKPEGSRTSHFHDPTCQYSTWIINWPTATMEITFLTGINSARKKKFLNSLNTVTACCTLYIQQIKKHDAEGNVLVNLCSTPPFPLK